MRIVSWNVNGLRAVFKKGFLDIFNSLQADIFCIQEIKAHLEQLPEELHTLNKDFTGHFFSAQRKGYSGVAVYAKDRPLSIIRGTDKEEFDREGRVITLEYPDFYIINCYAPNAQAELARIDYKTAFNDNLKEFLKKLKTNKAVILCGDLNVAHQPIDLKNPKTNEHNPGYSREEREKFTQLLAAGFIDIFRSLYPDRVAYTWWSYRFNARDKDIGWRIDYFIISPDLQEKIRDVIIHKEIYGSDHCPLSLRLDL